MLDAVTPDTRVIVASLVDYGSGQVHDVDRLAAFCAGRDILLAVDATQACGVMPVEAAGRGLPLVTVAGYKWMLGPYGCGFGRLDPAWWDRIDPVYVTWSSAAGADDYNALPRGDWKWAPSARRYDGPETANIVNVTGLARSAEFLGELGREAVHAHVTGLLDALVAGLPGGFRRRAPRAPVPGPILLVEHPDPAAVHAAYRRLREHDVHVSLRDDGIRVSPHVWNTPADVERLLELLAG